MFCPGGESSGNVFFPGGVVLYLCYQIKTVMALKKSITKRAATLIARGARTVGFADAYFYIEEQLYPDEAESVQKFCEWLNTNRHLASREMPFVEANFPNLYKHFLKSIQK
jgi:hypothetical protein